MLKAVRASVTSDTGSAFARKNEAIPTANAHVVFLTNFLPPYRSPVLRALSSQVLALKTLVCTEMEANRNWAPDWRELDVYVQKSISTKILDRHPDGFTQEIYLHVPYDTLPKLARFRPDVVISGELGARTIQAVLYRIAVPSSRLIIHADLSEHTELGRSGSRTLLRRSMVRHADAILVNGNSGARYVRSLGVPDAKVFRVPYSTDTSIYTEKKRTTEGANVTKLLHVGQLIERKGILKFLNNLVKWSERHSTRNLEFMLVGDGPLRAAILELKLPPNLTLKSTASVAYSAMPEIYLQADLFVLPTLADSWGLVVNEAMAAGLPILGSRKSQAVEELVKDRETGWIFNPDEPDDVDMALERALSAPRESLARMGEKARQVAIGVTAQFAAERIVQAIDYCFNPWRKVA